MNDKVSRANRAQLEIRGCMSEKVMRINEVCALLKISDTTLWRWRRAKSFPEPRSIPGSSVKGWTASAINGWIAENFGDEQEAENERL
ncbi:Prophage CP4-57 regulatory protein (AlpA) [Marinomonas gallaica]|uniref:Prophage CP4-57 regulatory protein (AlpA) n=1 Tax=Marinomonas gallaica TaxID=1806667 RepID=A0A1C3JRB2_9GAMM|nr:Prophage CP4-57 regulatory protein (AlpA) [Marinomonas gallaica]SBT20038.1 Prophage CP4-57 regulatory protein (AlpA) [Marinomonas gallaica]